MTLPRLARFLHALADLCDQRNSTGAMRAVCYAAGFSAGCDTREGSMADAAERLLAERRAAGELRMPPEFAKAGEVVEQGMGGYILPLPMPNCVVVRLVRAPDGTMTPEAA
jgi:hypothetical protein